MLCFFPQIHQTAFFTLLTALLLFFTSHFFHKLLFSLLYTLFSWWCSLSEYSASEAFIEVTLDCSGLSVACSLAWSLCTPCIQVHSCDAARPPTGCLRKLSGEKDGFSMSGSRDSSKISELSSQLLNSNKSSLNLQVH